MANIKLSYKYEPLFEWLSCLPDNPLHKVDTVVITGGRYSQKSFAVGLFSCIATKDFNHRVLYTRYTLTSAEDSIIPEFNEKIDILGAHDAFNVTRDRIEGVRNKSKIVFKGIKTSAGNQTAALKSLKDFSMFIVEESEEMPNYQDWDKIRKSIRALDVRNLNILLLNPATKEHWIYKELYEDRGIPEGHNGVAGNVLYIHTEYLDIEREYIPDNIFEDFEEKREAYEKFNSTEPELRDKLDNKTIKAASYFKHTVKGGWLNVAEGVIYSDWIQGEFKEVSPAVYGQDFGFSIDPTTLIKTSIDKKNKIIYAKELLYKPKLTTSDIYGYDKELAGDKALIYADSAEPRLIEEIKRMGLNMRETKKGQGSVTAGIAAIQDYRLVVDGINLVKELNNYVWHDKKSKTPVDAFNHLLDALRYAVYPQISKIETPFYAG